VRARADYDKGMPPRLHVIAHVKARPAHVETVRDILTGFVVPTRAEDGCFVYELFENADDPTHFTFIEEWLGQPSLDRHATSTHITGGRARLKDLTEGATQVLRYSRLA
jgi:quinol monooxygenase YgiN